MAILTKEEILRRRAPVIETLEVPEWGGAISIRRLSGNGRDAWDLFRSLNRDPETGRFRPDMRHFRATLVALSLCDERGESLDFAPEEIAALSEDDGSVLDRLFDACETLSGLGSNAVGDAKKNSGPAPSDDSGTS
jgi:hypothetical protein